MNQQESGAQPDLDRIFPGRQFISTILDLLESKQQMSGRWTRVYLQRAVMAGVIASLFYLASFRLVAVFAADGQTGPPAETGRILGAFVFGWALVFIYYTRSELLTSNMMVTVIGVYHRRISIPGGLRILAVCLLGNALGGALVAAVLRLSTLASGPTGEQMHAAVDYKLAYLDSPAAAGDLFVRAVLCNLLINLAMLLVYNGYIKDDITKSLAMVTSVFLFALLSLEHSVADTVLFLMVGFQHGLDPLRALGCIALVLLGNFVGGGLLIGGYYAYANDERLLQRHIEHERGRHG